MLNIFRDESNLNLSPDLWRSIETALDNSEFLIYLAHPAAARSFWINKEIEHWISTKSVSDLILVITAGEFEWDQGSNQVDSERTDVLPPALKQAFHNEPLYLDLRWAALITDFDQDPRFHSAVATLAATLRKTSVEDITGEEWVQHRKRIRYRNAAVASLAVLAVAALGFAWYATEQEKNATARNFTLRSAAALTASDPTRAAQLAADAWDIRHDDTARGALINAFYSQSFRYRDRLYATPFYAILHKSSESDSTLALAGDGNRFASYANGILQVFDNAGKKISAFDPGWNARPTALAMAHDGSAVCAGAASGDLLVAFSDASRLQATWQNKPDAALIHCTFNSDRTKVAFAADDGRAYVWSTEGTYLLSTPQGESKLLHVSFARDDARLVTVSFGKPEDPASSGVAIWTLDYANGGATLQASLGPCAACPDVHSNRISSAELSANGNYLITASVDKTARIWQLGHDIDLVTVLGGHLDSVESAHFSANEKHIVTTSSDQTIALWRWDAHARRATKVVSFLGHRNWVSDARLHADGNSAISAARDGTVRYWFLTGRAAEQRDNRGACREKGGVLHGRRSSAYAGRNPARNALDGNMPRILCRVRATRSSALISPAGRFDRHRVGRWCSRSVGQRRPASTTDAKSRFPDPYHGCRVLPRRHCS